MRSLTLLSTAFASLLVATGAQAQETANITASLTTYSTNQCCGGSITYNKVQAGQCVQSAGHPSVYGASISIRGFWGYDIPGGDDHLAYGYLTGFVDSGCVTKVYDIKWDGCTSIAEGNRAKSWMWTQETYAPWWRRGLDTYNATSRELWGPVVNRASPADVPTWLRFFDTQLGIEKKISLNRDSSEVETILSLYETKDFASLREWE